jgi:hypothetical protein
MKVLGYEICDFFTDIYIPSEIMIMDMFHRQDINPADIKPHSPYFKKLFFNYILKEYIRNITESDHKQFFIIGNPVFSELQDYIDQEEFIYTYNLNIKKAHKLIPMSAIIVDDTFDDYMEHPETFEHLTTKIHKTKDTNAKKNFSKLSSFLKTYELDYLDDKVFSSIKNKFMFS